MNPIEPKHIINWRGAEYALRFRYLDFATAEERLKKPLIGPLAADLWEATGGALYLATMLFIGICHADPKLKFNDVLNGMKLADIQTLLGPVQAALVEWCQFEGLNVGGDEKPVPFAVSETSGFTSGASPESTSDSEPPNSGS